MPIEISTRKLKNNDLKLKPVLTYHAPYVPVYQWGYGRMDSSTPGQGLMTCRVASCLAIVLHCPTTGRTILTHSPNHLYMNTFAPIVDWITGGPGQDLNLPAWYEGAGAKPAEVEVVVLRGYRYATAEAILFGHNEWMQDFERFFSMFTLRRHIRVNILDPTRVLSTGAVLVDKHTARITYLEVGVGVQARSPNPLENCIDVENPLLSQVYSHSQRSRDLFVGGLLEVQMECPPIFLQYDVSHYCLPLRLPDQGRQLIRSKRLREPLASQQAIINSFNQSVDWLDPRSTHTHPVFLCTLNESAILIGPPCERCSKIGSRQCTACKGAWYCGDKHQQDDWKVHKDWCKAHRIRDST